MTIVDARQRWKRQVIVECFTPLAEGLKQCRQLDVPKASRRLGEILYGAFQHRSHTHPVSGGVMMKGDSDLNHPLEELLVLGGRRPPDVFEGFVSIKELGFVEEIDSTNVIL